MNLNQYGTGPAAKAATAGGATAARARELEAGRLVARAVRARLAAADDTGTCTWFLVERARRDVGGLERSGVRQSLGRAVEAISPEAEVDEGELRDSLVVFGGILERHHQYEAAADAYALAREARPECAESMLHCARAERKAGRRDRALALYGRVRERGDGRLMLYAHLGEALLAEDVEEGLGRVLDEAEARGDGEVAAVVLEERARVRRGLGRSAEAVEDLASAGLRYTDVRDRLRVAHSLADALLAAGDAEAAREALHAAVDLAVPEDRDHAPQRLRAIARAMGDEVGLRRYPPSRTSSLVSLMPTRRSATGPSNSVAPRIRSWRDALNAAQAVERP